MDPFTPIIAAVVVGGAGIVGAAITGAATVAVGAASLGHKIYKDRKQARRNGNYPQAIQGSYIPYGPQPYPAYLPIGPHQVYGNEMAFHGFDGRVMAVEPITYY